MDDAGKLLLVWWVIKDANLRKKEKKKIEGIQCRHKQNGVRTETFGSDGRFVF